MLLCQGCLRLPGQQGEQRGRLRWLTLLSPLGPALPKLPQRLFPAWSQPSSATQRQQMGEELPPFLEKANQLCGQYTKLNFLDFKKR